MGFWKEQFGPNRTGTQDVFDVTFGLVLPILCFVADPIVFKSFSFFGPALLGDYQLVAYVVSTIEMGFFLMWRTFPTKVNALSPLFGGVLLAGACFSLVIGVVLLPLTLMALPYVIGVLGLMPFFSALVYLRNGVRAMKAQPNLPLASRITTATLSGVLVISSLVVSCMFVENSISASMDTVIYGSTLEAEAATNRLKWFRFIPLKQTDRLALAYGREWDIEKKATLGRVYWEITGEDPDVGLGRLSN